MRELEEHIIREHMYSDHAERMSAVKKNLRIARLYNVYANIAMALYSIASVYLWLSYTSAGIQKKQMLEEEIGAISFPFEGITMFTAPVIAILSYLADTFLLKKLNIVSQLIYLQVLVFSVLNLLVRFEMMQLSDIIILMVYSAVGLWTQDFAVRSYKELDYLKTQEGFPDFNILIDRDRHSKYAKYRDKWLKSEKKLDYFTENERPVTDYSVTESENGNDMDGIAVDNDKCENWFDGKNAAEMPPHSDDMEVLEHDGTGLPDDSEYIIDDPRRRPL